VNIIVIQNYTLVGETDFLKPLFNSRVMITVLQQLHKCWNTDM